MASGVQLGYLIDLTICSGDAIVLKSQRTGRVQIYVCTDMRRYWEGDVKKDQSTATVRFAT